VSQPKAPSTSSDPPGAAASVTEAAGQRAVVEVSGELDMSTGPALERQLAALVNDGVTDVVLDLSRVSFIDSSGLSVLVVALKRLRSRGGALRLAGCQSPVQTVLDLTALSRVFFMYPSVDAALADPYVYVSAR
jgi:anti-sigma B factor antagonist